jgi:hypothetical protein
LNLPVPLQYPKQDFFMFPALHLKTVGYTWWPASRNMVSTWKESELILCFASISLVATLILSGGSPDQERCELLNSLRANYTACCKYPALVMWSWQYDECTKVCSVDVNSEYCCMLDCCFTSMGVLSKNETKTGLKVQINAEAISRSFLLSVKNETKWQLVVNSSIQTCQSRKAPNDKTTCDGKIPLDLFEIVDCVYNNNYGNCPFWNPSNLKECNHTLEYYQLCFSNLDR